MKLSEITSISTTDIGTTQLDEVSLRNLAAAGALGLASLSAPAMAAGHHAKHHDTKHHAPHKAQHHAKHDQKHSEAKKKPHIVVPKYVGTMPRSPEEEILVNYIVSKYKTTPELADYVVSMAEKYERPVWPKAKDILAIVGIESAFDPTARSKLRHDPAIGLMQVRPGAWRLDPKLLETNIEHQIKTGANALATFYDRLHDPEAAVHSYNIGLTNYRNQENLNPSYVVKYNKELSAIKQALQQGKPATARAPSTTKM